MPLSLQSSHSSLKEKFGLFVDFEFWTEICSGGTDSSIPVGLRKSSNGKWLKTAFEENAHIPVFLAEMLVTKYVLSSSRHLVTPFDLHTFFAFDSGSLSIAGG